MNLEQYPFKKKPFEHQLKWLQQYSMDEYHALYHGMGTGKSMVMVANAAILYDAAKISALVVVSLNGSHDNWGLREVPKHMPEHIKYTTFIWRSYLNKECRRDKALSVKPRKDKLRVVCINCDAFSHKSVMSYLTVLLERHRHKVMLVVDEATWAKNPKSKRSVNIVKVAPYFLYRRILTGSPITETPFNIYNQGQILNRGMWSMSYFHFTRYYGRYTKIHLGTRSFNKLIAYRNVDELKKEINNWATFIKKDECLDLPPKTFEEIDVELTHEQKRLTKEFKQEQMAWVGEDEFTASNALHVLGRLHQISLGYLINEEGSVVRIKASRLTRLLELLEETDGSVIIWSHLRPALEDLAETLRKNYDDSQVVEYHGGILAKERNEAIDRFQNKDARFFIGNPQVGGYSLTLTAAATVVYYSNSFSLEQRIQSEDRAHRIGQTQKVTCIDLVARGSIDEHVLKALKSKVDIENQITGLVRPLINEV